MALFRKAVEKQREFIINKLLEAGVFQKSDHIHNLTLTELTNEFKKFQNLYGK